MGKWDFTGRIGGAVPSPGIPSAGFLAAARLANLLIFPIFILQVAAANPESDSGQRTTVSSANASVGTMPVQPVWAVPPLDDQRTLVVGDQLGFRILEEKDPPVLLRIDSSGELEFPMIGRVKAEGRTCKQIADEVRARLEASFYQKATVSISLVAASNLPLGRVFVTGAVVREGTILIPRDGTVTVLDAILEVGGFTDFADLRRVRVFRQNPGQPDSPERITVDMKAIMRHGRKDLDIELQPGDQVVVPERWINF